MELHWCVLSALTLTQLGFLISSIVHGVYSFKCASLPIIPSHGVLFMIIPLGRYIFNPFAVTDADLGCVSMFLPPSAVDQL